MPTNERQNARKAKMRKSEQKTKRIIWIAIILVAAILIVMKVMELDVNSIKSRITGEEGSISEVLTAEAYPYSLDSSKNVKVTAQNDKLNILTDVSCTVLNPTDAQVLYTFSHGYANPIMKAAGNYFCTFDQGANRLRLDTLSAAVYETKTENAVLTANVAKNGSVIYAMKSNDSKSTVVVMNSSLKKLAQFEVNDGYVVLTAIDSSGKRFAYATVNTQNAKLVTTVHTFHLGDDAEKAHFDFEGTNLLDLQYCASDLYIVGDDCVATVTAQKKLHEVFKTGEVNTVCFNYTSGGELVYVYSKYSSANENYLAHINTTGKVGVTVELNQKPKYVSSSSNEMTVLLPDKIVTYSITKGEKRAESECDDSLSSVHKLSTKCFVCRHQLIDVVEQKKISTEKKAS